MPGAQDRWGQLAEPGMRNQDGMQPDLPQHADRPERGSIEDLRQRLERLPPGHPSSPYNDDLTRKPPVARLKDLELPFHDTNGAARHHDPEPETLAAAASAAGTTSAGGAAANGSPARGLATEEAGPSLLSDPGPGTRPADLGAANALDRGDGAEMADRAGTAARRSGNGIGPVGRRAAANGRRPADPYGADEVGPVGRPAEDQLGPANGFGAAHDFRADDAFGAGSTVGTDSELTAGDDFSARNDSPAADEAGLADVEFSPADELGDADELGFDGEFSPAGRIAVTDPYRADGLGADRLAADRLNADRLNADRLNADRLIADRLSADRLSADGLGRTDGWFATPEWSVPDLGRASDSGRASGWDGASEWDTNSDPDAAGFDGTGEQRWADPGPGTDTLSRAVVDPVSEGDDEPPRIGPDGSWEWNGRYLTPDEYRIAEEALTRCRVAEGRNVFGSYGHSGLTPAMRRIEAQLESGELLPDTEGRALKSPERFMERLADLILRHPDKTAEELSLEVHDGIRYAFIFDVDDYAEATLQAHSRLKGHGFELEARWNGWESREYKGINSRWRDPAHDMVFEVQFHTAQSWDVWQRARGAYKRITDPRTSPAERARLRAVHAENSARIPVPPRSAAIPDFRKEAV
jgi:hypothetical protein